MTGKVTCKLCQQSWSNLREYQQDNGCDRHNCLLKLNQQPPPESRAIILVHPPQPLKASEQMRATQVGVSKPELKHPIPKQVAITTHITESEVLSPDYVTKYMDRLFVKVPKAIVFSIIPKKGK